MNKITLERISLIMSLAVTPISLHHFITIKTLVWGITPCTMKNQERKSGSGAYPAKG